MPKALESIEADRPAAPRRFGRMSWQPVKRLLQRMAWPVLYLLTVGSLVWWYEIRPRQQALEAMQGLWQSYEGRIPHEQPLESYLQIDGHEAWRVYPGYEKWVVKHDRLSLRPARNFFVVRRQFGFDYGTTRESEYVVCIKDNALYHVRGVARLDPMLEGAVEVRRPAEKLPPEAIAAIQHYIERHPQVSPPAGSGKLN